jgi:RNA polymerase sigma factor (sigma-70 family)
MPEISDESLMLNVRDGKIADLAVLFDRYQLRMYNFFLKMTFDQEASEDLTQALFYRILKYKQNYREEQGSFKTWVYQMARNIHLDFCKSENKTRKYIIPLDETHVNVAGKNEGYSEDDYSRLDKALHRLEPEQRQILVMSRFQGLKYKEIADVMKLSVSALKVRVHRVMHELRTIYFKDNN